MGLIMLILIGAAPAAYALNRAIPESTTPMFLQATQDAESVFSRAGANKCAVQRCCPSPRHVGEALKTKPVNRPEVYAALATLTADIAQQGSTMAMWRTLNRSGRRWTAGPSSFQRG